MIWGYRNSVHGIPSTRTKTLVEAHRRLLKRRYLVMNNRPRMEFVAHAIDSQMVPKYNCDYEMFVRGIKKGAWRKEFVKKWKYHAQTPIHETYDTNLGIWWCDCPPFRIDNF